MKIVGYVRVSTDRQADRGVSLDAQAEKIRAMAVVHNAELLDIIIDGGESAKSLNRPGMARLLALVDADEDGNGRRSDAGRLSHKRSNGERVGNIPFGYRLCADGKHHVFSLTGLRSVTSITRVRGNCNQNLW
jgi:Resolvase, N terminal domain